ncbi:MAG TPA: DUF447 domain-containing protein [Pirellulales bacterium]|nr:DUF447 domain-containing protein [Pirellulales bacterium]
MILEGIVTTVNADGGVNISPMGPIVDAASAGENADIKRLVLRPYQTSTTFANLKRIGEAVFHVTDDVLLLATAAVGEPDPRPPLVPAESVKGFVIADACRWYALRVTAIDDSQPRSRITADVVDRGRIRDFFGFNRAKHAVLEAAILATRVGLMPGDDIVAEFKRLAVIVEKTGGEQEHTAFQFLQDYVDRAKNQ